MNNRLSIRLRLLLAVSAITLVALGLTDGVVYSSLHSYLYRQVDNSLESSLHAVEQTLTRPTNGSSGGAIVPNSSGSPLGPDAAGTTATGAPGGSAFCEIGQHSAPGMFIEVLSAKHEVVTGSSGLEECPAFQQGGAMYSPKLSKTLSGFTTDGADGGEPTVSFTAASTQSAGPAFQVLASELPNGRVLIVARSVDDVGSTLSQLLLVELLVTGGALVAAVGLGLWLVRVGLRPLRDIERTAEAIAGGDLMPRVPNVNPKTEVGHLATAFNVMVERMQVLFGDLRASESRLRRFVGDASHELRTPIAAVSAYAQLFHEGAATRTEDLARVMSGIERESGRMAHLVDDLLTLAKLDDHRLGEAEPVEIVGLVLEAAETARLVGPEWPVAVVADEPIEVLADVGALRQVVDNLLANVHAHTPEGTHTTVTVRRISDAAQIAVGDDGPGMSEDDAAHVFERFFRVDPSRSRGTGGAGLGLAIVASIVSALGGQVDAIARPGDGALFRVTLPALEAEAATGIAD